MIFKLTFKFPSTENVVAFKKFNTTNANRGWALARKWQDNCVAICGKNHLGEIVENYLLERVDITN